MEYSINNDGECVMRSKSDNIDIMRHDKADGAIEELFESILSRYQIGLETSMKGSDKKATTNLTNKNDNKYFHYAVKIALNH